MRTVEQTPFFERMRLLTLVGMFAMPKYGGNRDGIGWKLLGFQDQHIFQPPFGYYDRDYPGFAIQVVRMTTSYRLGEPVDFAIVGSGAAGGVIARELSQAGFRSSCSSRGRA